MVENISWFHHRLLHAVASKLVLYRFDREYSTRFLFHQRFALVLFSVNKYTSLFFISISFPRTSGGLFFSDRRCFNNLINKEKLRGCKAAR